MFLVNFNSGLQFSIGPILDRDYYLSEGPHRLPSLCNCTDLSFQVSGLDLFCVCLIGRALGKHGKGAEVYRGGPDHVLLNFTSQKLLIYDASTILLS